MQITITKIVINYTWGKAIVLLFTDLPQSMPTDPNPSQILELSCPIAYALEYCQKHFPGVPIEDNKPQKIKVN